MSNVHQFLLGALTATSATAGCFFLRYWFITRDRFFVFFSSAFFALSVGWLGLGIVSEEHRPLAFSIRLLAFLLIIAGILDKNRRADQTR